ncbi:MAG: hypothetical protein MJA83_14750 [Gammaproteobacteria bacterium]|nr:hypothetical protein [Gammaproteobacteria bacterium]
MSTATKQSMDNPAKPKSYTVKTVEKTDMPDFPGDNWYRYVIGEDSTELVGYFRGTQREAANHAQITADKIAERGGPKGKSPYAARAKK